MAARLRNLSGIHAAWKNTPQIFYGNVSLFPQHVVTSHHFSSDTRSSRSSKPKSRANGGRAFAVSGSYQATLLNCSAGNHAPRVALFSTTVVAREAAKDEPLVISPKSDDWVPPDVPPVPGETIGEMVLQAPTSDLAALGLGGWWPSGLLQTGLDQLHTLGMPWWAAIISATLTARFLLFPLAIKSQRASANMQRNMPEFQRLQQKLTESRTRGDYLETAKTSVEIQKFMKENDINPLKSMLPMLVQAPVFMSFFIGLRGMAGAPVESMKTGGLSWFTDLTLSDPYFILPILTSATLLVVVEVGAEGGVQAQQMPMMRYIMRGLPVLVFCFSAWFPSAVLLYWCASNFFTLLQVALLRLPAVRAFVKIPQRIQHPPGKLLPKKGFRESWRESSQNARIQKEIEDRSRVDSVRFREAGMGPIPKTYKYDPTKPREATPAKVVSARKSD